MRKILVGVLMFVAVALAEGPLEIRERGKDHFETGFPAGGHLMLHVRSGDVRVTGTDDEKVTVRYGGRRGDEVQEVEVRFHKSSDGGDLSISGGPRNDFQITIEIPRETDLHMRMPFGALQVEGVRGNKNVELHAGDVEIEIGDPSDYARIEASVTTGGLDSGPLGISKGGLFRSFKRDGPGKFRIRAHVGSGALNLR